MVITASHHEQIELERSSSATSYYGGREIVPKYIKERIRDGVRAQLL